MKAVIPIQADRGPHRVCRSLTIQVPTIGLRRQTTLSVLALGWSYTPPSNARASTLSERDYQSQQHRLQGGILGGLANSCCEKLRYNSFERRRAYQGASYPG